jgi:hypothetical protein
MFIPEKSSVIQRKFSLKTTFREIFKINRHTEKPLNYYQVYNSDHTRSIIIKKNEEAGYISAGFYTLDKLPSDNYVIMPIMVITQSMDDHKFDISIEGVPFDNTTKVLMYAHYLEDGVLDITGDVTLIKPVDPRKPRNDRINQGYLSMEKVYGRINFVETAKRFLENAMSPNPSFLTPELVPYDPQLTGNDEPKLSGEIFLLK